MASPFFPAIETCPIDAIRNFQDIKLREHLHQLNSISPFYKRLFASSKVNIEKISGFRDLEQIPTTSKEDLQRHNADFICVDRKKIVDYITTSGTQGDPVTFALTEKDLERLAYNEAISFTCADAMPGEIFQLMTTIDRRFMAGLAYFLGIRKLEGSIVRVGNGIPELQWDTIQRISPDTIIAVPSFILKIIDYAENHGIDYRSSSVKKAVCIGEPLRNNDLSYNTLARKIVEKWPIKLYSTYASTEMATSFTECSAGAGGHHHPELVIVEFLDDQNQPVKEGEQGEVTITPLGVEGMPLLRFKTGDICSQFTEPCSCGRTSFRLGPVIGRKNQMIKYRGTTLYPPSLYDILDTIDYVDNYVVEVSTNDIETDEIVIHAGSRQQISMMESDIKDHFRARLRVAPSIVFHTFDEIHRIQFPEASRKPVKFIDNRVK
ncbi:MAG: AMP-binding protein [Bacteroidales bacterium]|nr:AMP-binding protein [Bacteroidales bacterium]